MPAPRSYAEGRRRLPGSKSAQPRQSVPVFTYPDEKLLTMQEMADYLRISVVTLKKLGLPSVDVGPNRRRYAVSIVLAFLQAHPISAADEDSPSADSDSPLSKDADE